MNAAGPTYVSGPISADTTWYFGDSPYIVTGDVTVEPGATLTIEPGVEVRLDPTFTIFVDGTLIANGTNADRITFTSNLSVPAKGDWYTIRLRTDYNLINNTDIEYASYGVFITFFGTHNTVANSTINNCEYDGIYITNSDNNLIYNCTITSNDRYGITIYESYATHVENCTIQYNNFFGINLNASTFTEIYDTNISYNSGKGILLYSNSHNTTISGCEIDLNNHNGIDLWGTPDNDIIDTTVIGNKGIGIDFGKKTKHQWIENCTITNNENTGIDLRGSSRSDIVECEISWNKGQGGIYSANPVNCIDIVKTDILNNLAGNGIDIYEAKWINITDSNISKNIGNGIFFNNSVIHSYNEIKNCTVAENGINGVLFHVENFNDNSFLKYNSILSNKIYLNNQQGIYFHTHEDASMDYTYIQSNNIYSNIIYSNIQNGILFFSYDHHEAYVQNNNIHSNTIYSHNQSGISFIAARTWRYYIQNNNIHSNSIYSNNNTGINFDSYKLHSPNEYHILNNNIYSNTIYSNGQFGIHLYAFATGESQIENNNIYSNKIYHHVGSNSSLGDALDNNCLHFTTGADSYWTVDTSTYHHDGDSAKSGRISHNQRTYIETNVLGPGTLSFYWTSSTEDDAVEFYLDGDYQTQIKGEQPNWIQKIYDIPPGFHSLSWVYIKDGSISGGLDCGWLDKIEFTGQYLNSGIFLHADYPTANWQESNIYNNTIISNIYGIILSNIKSHAIYSNNISCNKEGVWLRQSTSNSIRYNNITNNNGTGINLTLSSSNNIIENNNITSNNKSGILIIEDSNDNIIFRNNISHNAGIGLNIIDASGNQIHHNNFVNNTQNAYDSTIALNDWDDGAEGNFWSDYLGSDDNGDGFGEDPYVIPGGGSRDWHPFIQYVNVTPPYIIFTTPADDEINVPVDTNISIFFSKEMDTASVEGAISISGGLTPTGFVWEPGNRNVTFTPSSILEMATKYTVTITTDAMDSEGFRIRIAYIFTFTTLDVDPPVILLTSPVNGDTFVDRNAPVVVTFNESMNITSVTFSCFPDPGGWTVSWNENRTVATYSHNKFGNEATYTFNITAARDLAGLDLVAGPVPNPWWFSTPDTVGPEITSTSPFYDEENVSTTANIVVDFNEEIDLPSITFTCLPDSLGWSVVWTNNNKTATFSHNEFTERTWYSFHVTGAKDLLGNDLNPGPVPNPWTFTTTGDYIPPQITLTSPANNTFDVELDAGIIVTFNEAMDNTSLNFICIPDPEGWSVSWSGGNTIVTFSHNPFENATTYTFHINTGKDVAGNDLGPGAVPNPWSFTTVGDLVAPEIISTSPVHNEVDVHPAADIVVTFNEAMDPLSLGYTCTPDPGGWSESWSTGDMIVTFTHDQFEIETTYIFQITTARDRSGNDLISGTVPNPWLFTTVGDIIGPQIILTSPADNEVDVDPSVDIIVTFNEAMDNSSLNYLCIPDPGGWSESWSNGDTVVTFTHNPLVHGTIINFYIIAAKDISGNDLTPGAVPNPWSFTTSDLVAPEITSASPADNEIDVEQNTNIEVIFSEPMDTASISFICTPDPGGWSESWSNGDTVITFSHNPFAFKTLYDFYIIGGKDISGNDLDSGLVPNPWSFTTIRELVAPQIISTDPLENEINVDLDRNIIVTFSEAMDTSSIAYICTPDPGGWFVGWSNGDKVFTLSHNPFLVGTIYSFQITSAKDISGNDFTGGPVPNPWSFTTQADLVAPQIDSTSPFDDEVNVNVRTYIIVEFSEAMDTSTIEYKCSPDPGGWFESWSDGNTVLTLLHNSFDIGTTYTFDVTAAKDLSGNNLASGAVPSSWDFTTVSLNSIIITPSEVSVYQNDTIILIAWAFDSQNNPITDVTYTWTLSNDLGTISSQRSQIAVFQAKSNIGTCYINVTSGGKIASAKVTIKSIDLEEEEPADEEPENLLWLWFLILVIVIISLINLRVAMKKEKPKIEEKSAEPAEKETTLEDMEKDEEEIIEESNSEIPPSPPSD
ncbi:MAG: Ig-like domain-containing protein [Thermoplasmata archaeon]|nr:MAG: Ig-like domain-containing protein [Thermoplasmata archaeon]